MIDPGPLDDEDGFGWFSCARVLTTFQIPLRILCVQVKKYKPTMLDISPEDFERTTDAMAKEIVLEIDREIDG